MLTFLSSPSRKICKSNILYTRSKFKIQKLLNKNVKITLLRGGGVATFAIVKVKIWLLSRPNLILGGYSKEFGFFRICFNEKKPLLGKNHILDLQWSIHFLTFLNIDQNTPKKFKIVIIQDFLRKLLSKSILDIGKCPNQKTYTFTLMRFWVGALPEFQNIF